MRYFLKLLFSDIYQISGPSANKFYFLHVGIHLSLFIFILVPVLNYFLLGIVPEVPLDVSSEILNNVNSDLNTELEIVESISPTLQNEIKTSSTITGVCLFVAVSSLVFLLKFIV